MVEPDESLPVAVPLPAVADPAFDRIAALAKSILGVPVAMVTMVDRVHQTMPGAAGLPEPIDEARELPLSMSLCQHVVREGAPLIVTDASTDERVSYLDAVTQIGVGAYAGMPVTDATGAAVGSLCAVDFDARTWSRSELDLLGDLAATASAELQLRESADRADRARERTQVLLDLSESLSSTTSVIEVSERVQRLAAERMQAGFGGITVLDESTATLKYVDTHSPELMVQSTHRSFAITADTPSAAAVRSHQPLFYRSLAELAHAFPSVVDAAARTGLAFAYLPLNAGTRPLGSLGLSWAVEREFTHADREVLMAFARYTAQALERAQLLTERREVAWTLQQALLPELPEVTGFDLEGRYHPAHATDAVGGDWYDAFEVADGSLVVVVGDVVGHDTAAAAAMGQLRATLRALAIATPDQPSAILGTLDRVMRSLARSRLATALLGTAHDSAGITTFTWSNAGHLPPLLLEPGCSPTYLTRPFDRLLGLRVEPVQRTSHQVELVPGATVLLYTDGLIERRDRDLDEGLDILARVAEDNRALELPDFLDTIVATTRDDEHLDDTVVFAIRKRA